MAGTTRLTAQLILLDSADRVLLLRREDDDGVGFWGPVGGTIEAGESAQDAALREAWEETGLNVTVGPEVWRRQHAFTWRGQPQEVDERWFLARAPSIVVSTARWSPNERLTITSYGWWSVDELREATERTVPGDLAGLLARLLANGPPERPVIVGV